MKVLLISGIVTNAAQSNPEWTAENDNGDFSPSGLMYIAGYLRHYAPHHEIKILDANLLRYTQQDIERDVRDFMPDIVGMTTYTDILFDTLETIRGVKRVSKDIKTVLGGAHPTNHPLETVAMSEVDFVCIGEGEILVFELVEALEGKRELSGIKGLVWNDKEGNIFRNQGSGYVPNLNLMRQPAFDLIPYEKYYSMIGTGASTGVICSSRGCPYQCTFCSKPFSTYRGRTVENIIEEMKLYYDRGVREFMFFDDMFNLPAKRALKVSEAIRQNFPDIQWCFRGRADQITEELGEELRRSNCKQVSVGAEAHTDEAQKELRTGKSVEKTKNAVRILRKYGIKSNTNWIIGLPQHRTAKDVDDMLKVIFDIDPDYVQFSILMLWDDTEIYKEAIEKGIISESVWNEYIKNPHPGFLIPAWEEHLSRKEQSELLRKCYSRFYLRPKVIYRQIMEVASWTTFKVKFRGFLLMLVPLFYPILSLFRENFSRRKQVYQIQ